MASFDSKMRVEKLTANNFYTWHIDLLAILGFNDLLEFIEKEIPTPSGVNSEKYVKYIINKVKTFSIIRGSLSASLIFLVGISQNSPFRLYRLIVDHCNTKNDSNINGLKNKFI